MNVRVTTLRQQSLDTQPWLSPERAELLTAFYKTAEPASVPVLRARAFAYLLANKTIHIGPGELIVGERGPAPKGTPTYPELCCHTLEDLDVLDTREKIRCTVSSEAKQTYARDIIPVWQGRSMRDRLFAEMTADWTAAYEAGVFTEFMEQRAPGHTALGDVIYRKGFLDLEADIERSLAALDYFGDPQAYDKQEELKAMRMACDAIIRFAGRHAEKARALAVAEPDPNRRRELEAIAAVCDRVPAHAPRTFHEALQAYWFVHLGVITELNTWDAFNPGRLDQHLYPFFRRERDAGTLTEEHARELLQCFWVKFNNQPAPPKVGVTAAESGTYTDFANINTGGLRTDGSDGVNDLTYLILDVIDEMRLLQPSRTISRATSVSSARSGTARRNTATTTSGPMGCCDGSSTPCTSWSKGVPTRAAASSASTTSRRPATSTSARSPAPRPTTAWRSRRCPTASRRSRAPTATAPPRS